MEDAVGIVRQSGLFDKAHYSDSYALHDPILTLVDPISHYLAVGFRRGYTPSPQLDIESYLDSNPDVARSNMSPLLHFLLFGKAEGRKLHRLLARSERSEPTV